MNNKLLDDARAAGFYIDNNKHKDLSASNIFLIELLTKFAELQIPNGYKLVPTEPTDEMLNNAGKAWNEILSMASGDEYLSWQFALTIKYKAMLDASPPTDKDIK